MKDALTHRSLALFDGLGRLPPRAQIFVDTEQRRADVLAAALALAVGLFIGGLYAITPRALDQMAGFKPVPMFLLGFVLLAGGRLAIALAMRLPKWYVYASVAADFAIFYALIWSFHLQYEQPPAFYLKAPTLLYVFILIALRALRFEVGSLVFAGICACAGWAALTLYAIQVTPAPAITRDFQAYMTSNLVLLGAEIDKMTAMALFTLILTLVIARGRRQLVSAAFGRSASEDLARFLPADVARAVIEREEAPTAGAHVTVTASILIADIRSFSNFSAAVGADEAARTLVEFESRIGSVVTASGGTIDKFLGDGVLVTFGCVRPSESCAADALACAFAIVADCDIWAGQRRAQGQTPLRVDVAVSTGVVAYGAVGTSDRLEITVIGDPVNIAAKLEKETRAAGARILVDAATETAARQQGSACAAHLTASGPRHLANLAEPVMTYAALAAPHV